MGLVSQGFCPPSVGGRASRCSVEWRRAAYWRSCFSSGSHGHPTGRESKGGLHTHAHPHVCMQLLVHMYVCTCSHTTRTCSYRHKHTHQLGLLRGGRLIIMAETERMEWHQTMCLIPFHSSHYHEPVLPNYTHRPNCLYTCTYTSCILWVGLYSHTVGSTYFYRLSVFTGCPILIFFPLIGLLTYHIRFFHCRSFSQLIKRPISEKQIRISLPL